jgi:hypothetical protein
MRAGGTVSPPAPLTLGFAPPPGAGGEGAWRPMPPAPTLPGFAGSGALTSCPRPWRRGATGERAGLARGARPGIGRRAPPVPPCGRAAGRAAWRPSSSLPRSWRGGAAVEQHATAGARQRILMKPPGGLSSASPRTARCWFNPAPRRWPPGPRTRSPLERAGKREVYSRSARCRGPGQRPRPAAASGASGGRTGGRPCTPRSLPTGTPPARCRGRTSTVCARAAAAAADAMAGPKVGAACSRVGWLPCTCRLECAADGWGGAPDREAAGATKGITPRLGGRKTHRDACTHAGKGGKERGPSGATRGGVIKSRARAQQGRSWEASGSAAGGPFSP